MEIWMIMGFILRDSVKASSQTFLISISLGRGDWIAEAARSYGGKVFATVTNASHSKKALYAGADVLIVMCHEAAAHGGGRRVRRADTGARVAIPRLSRRRCGGGLRRRSGPRHGPTTTEESPLDDQIKGAVSNLIPDGGVIEADMLYGKNFDDIPARVMRSPTAVRLNAAPVPFPAVAYWALVFIDP